MPKKIIIVHLRNGQRTNDPHQANEIELRINNTWPHADASPEDVFGPVVALLAPVVHPLYQRLGWSINAQGRDGGRGGLYEPAYLQGGYLDPRRQNAMYIDPLIPDTGREKQPRELWKTLEDFADTLGAMARWRGWN